MARGATVLGGLVLAVAGGAAGAAGVLALQPRGTPAWTEQQLGGPGSREIAALEARVAALEARAEQLPPLAVGAGETGGGDASATAPVAPGGVSASGSTDEAAGSEPGGNAPAGAPSGTGGAPPAGPAASPARNAVAVAEIAKTLGTLRKRVQRLEDAGADVDVAKLSADELAQMGVEAMEAKQQTKGLRLLGALLERDPDHPKAADARLQFGFYGEDDAVAAHHMEEFMARNTDHAWHPYGNFYLGRRYEKLGDAERAQRVYEAELTTGDDNPFFGVHTRNHLAKLADARGDAAAAERWRREALAKFGSCTWGTVKPVLAEMRQALGLPEPAPK